ncbi:MAG TPA: glycoside hydrolase family 36 protein [Acidimicrobiales bacterium]|jgi:alpha-galactosidase|nr:glycoside hydrolase family 36 protein [Acidimicrobiales bacterium]
MTDLRIEVISDGAVEVAVTTDGSRVDIEIRNAGRDTVRLERAEIETPLRPARVLEHGHQSWSAVRRTTAHDVRPERRDLPDWAQGTHLSAPDRAGLVVTGDQFLVTDAGVCGFLDARSHLGTIEARADGSVVAVALLDDVPLEPGAERRLDPLWITAGRPGPLYSAFADAWGATAGARVPDRNLFGWCSWYQYFAEVLPENIRTNLELAAVHGVDVVQIDDGYQAAIGDWLIPRGTWAEGTQPLAAEIRARGVQAGIWTAPFLVGEDSTVLAEHPDWVPRHKSGHGARAMYNPWSWGGWALVLDTTRPDVLDHLRTTYAALVEQGFDYHKIDFCYSAALPAARFDPTKTRAESLRLGLDAVREGIGADSFLLGCGCPFGPAVGVVDAMRVSADVAPTWEPANSWPGLEETAPAAMNAIIASVLRAPLHRRVFLNDPDCLLIRPTGTSLDANQREVLTNAIAGTGAFLLLSDDLSTYTDREWDVVERLRARQPELDTTLDIDDPFADAVVVRSSKGTTLTIDWTAPFATLEPPL